MTSELIAHLQPPTQVISREPCVFPFTYGDVTHYSCISTHSDFDWCSLDKEFQGRWRYCTGLVLRYLLVFLKRQKSHIHQLPLQI
ncbi:binder of sperm protein homolog 2-like [Symphalangus syndactylus]|uniref:binder of sperm protein homolog 2-like n=1 Tax=Symphalangus syndactylus TaxID=9590 RepID=UPI0024421BA8|nr:binder of sperm protein homolog 2-like [Symphalangus syndactylus]